MKRLLKAFLSDIRYQWRYGFYFIYAFMVAAFIAIIRLLPESWQQTAVVFTLLSDPVLLGFFFIGGILQLERGEGLLDALFISPLRSYEYIFSKALSLGLIATAAGFLIAYGSGLAGLNYALLLVAMLIGSMCFTFIGISVSINLRSMNAFLSIDGLWDMLLLIPPLLLMFGVTILPLEVFPSSSVLRLLQSSAGFDIPFVGYHAAILIAWTAAAFYLAYRRLNSAISRLGSEAA